MIDWLIKIEEENKENEAISQIDALRKVVIGQHYLIEKLQQQLEEMGENLYYHLENQ